MNKKCRFTQLLNVRGRTRRLRVKIFLVKVANQDSEDVRVIVRKVKGACGSLLELACKWTE